MSKDATREPAVVVVGPGGNAVRTVEYALHELLDSRADRAVPLPVDVLIVGRADGATVRETKTHIEAAVSSFAANDALHASVDCVQSGDAIDAVIAALDGRDTSWLFLADDIDLSVERLREEPGVARAERAPGDDHHGRQQLLHSAGLRRLATVFAMTYLFYLAVGGFAGGLDLLTGAVSAAVVAVALSQVAFAEVPTLRRTGTRLLRMVLFLPVLLWEVVKANFAIAYVILHPRLPIEPSMDVHETNASEELEQMVLANSITLTPGTLAVDVNEGAFTIHSLTPSARADLEEGRLERLVAWVFHGRSESGVRDGPGGDDQ